MPRYQKAGCVLINSNRKLLIVHQTASDFWGFPKGSIKKYEPQLAAALRELFEETGQTLDINLINRYVGIGNGHFFIAIGNFSELCAIDNHEIDAYEWVSLNELKKRKCSSLTRILSRKIEYLLNKL